MRRLLLTTALAAACCGALLALGRRGACAPAGCKDTYVRAAPDTDTRAACQWALCRYEYTKHWTVYFLDGYERRVEAWGNAEYHSSRKVNCPAVFREPTFVDETGGTGRWTQLVHDGKFEFPSWGCSNAVTPRKYTVGHTCQTAAGGCTPAGYAGCPAGTTPNNCGLCCPAAARDACAASGGYYELASGTCHSNICPEQQYECVAWGESWNMYRCSCTGNCPGTPILVDVAGDGFDLTGPAGGVFFDLGGDGRPERVPWTAPGSDDAWLALDRDGDGAITKGAELFGNFTFQPGAAEGAERQGFLALAEFDREAGAGNGGMGGNGDGLIDERDAAFSSLRLWRDADHDGVSGPGELHALESLGLARLHLDYKESRRVDEHGNRFKYRAKVDDARGSRAGRWAWDVFLAAEPPPR